MNNIHIEKQKFEINFYFYQCLKVLNGLDGLSDSQLNKTFELLCDAVNQQAFLINFETSIIAKIRSEQKKMVLKELLLSMDSALKYDVFVFSIYMLTFKPLLLHYAKLIELDVMLEDHHLLSLKRDDHTKNTPYAFRVNGALISLVFFSFMERREKKHFPTADYHDVFIQRLFDYHAALKAQGLEANQMFMIMFQESISQSIKSSSGTNLEELVVRVLVNENIKNIEKRIDDHYHELEYDHFFCLKGKTYGISTKRTMRERYKQFKKIEGAEADVFIHITSGLDLNEAKAKIITSDDFGCYIFVFPEIYAVNIFLQNNPRVFSTKDLTRETLLRLA
ncbi:MAG: hypothetical protein Q9M28_03295 [Mariprofundaceae bacterium]|nr:hypothetical protein [Mariprofundaceae bacterium]